MSNDECMKCPKSLWEAGIEHAAYLHNRSHTKSLMKIMPFEAWTGRRPDVSHLQEFRAPVWIKHQGLHLTKFDQKSWMMILVGYNDGLKSVKYYCVQTRKIWISRNYCFLSSSD